MADLIPKLQAELPATDGSMASYGVQKEAMSAQNPSVYPEELGAGIVDQPIDSASTVKNYFKDLGTKTPAERAEIGGKYGAAVGLTMNGPVGAMIGAGIGAMASRGIGLVQSGEAEDNSRKQRMGETLASMEVIGQDGMIDFGEMLGKSMPITADANYRLPNINAIGNEGRDRSIYELDKTNPFTQRALSVARPLAYMFSQGMMGYTKSDVDDRDKTSLNNATNMLTNALIADADSIDLVYERARSLSDKMGLSEDQTRSYLASIKDKVDTVDALNMADGLKVIYRGK